MGGNNMKFENTVKEIIKNYGNKENINYILFTIPEDIYDGSLDDTIDNKLDELCGFKITELNIDDVKTFILISDSIKEFNICLVEHDVEPIKYYPYYNIILTKDNVDEALDKTCKTLCNEITVSIDDLDAIIENEFKNN
jgi:hypothetical protein